MLPFARMDEEALQHVSDESGSATRSHQVNGRKTEGTREEVMALRKVIAAINVSLDGFIEGPHGELDWVMEDDESAWEDLFEMLESVDTFLLGRVMYPGYERYWLAVLADPKGPLPFTGQPATRSEIAYARLADRTLHLVLSRTLEKVEWKATRIVRDLEEIRKLKQGPGKDMQVVGGATLVSSLMNQGLIDELRLTVSPLILGGGKPLFKDVKDRRSLKFLRAKPLGSGKVSLVYETRANR